MRELHLDVAGAEHGLLVGALLQLKRADGGKVIGGAKMVMQVVMMPSWPMRALRGADPPRQPRVDRAQAAAALARAKLRRPLATHAGEKR